MGGAKNALGPFRELRQTMAECTALACLGLGGFALPQSHGFYESLGGDIIHFPFQEFTVCRIPSIYNPHDLQHLHYPQFFSEGNR